MNIPAARNDSPNQNDVHKLHIIRISAEPILNTQYDDPDNSLLHSLRPGGGLA